MNVTSATTTPSLTLGSDGVTINSTASSTTTWISSLSTVLAATFANAVVVTANSQVTSGENSSGAGVTHTIGALSIGAQTLTIAAGSGITCSATTSGVTIGATTLTGDATFNVVNGSLNTTRATLGALTGTANITKTGQTPPAAPVGEIDRAADHERADHHVNDGNAL